MKKLIIYVVVLAVLGIVFLVPGIRNTLKNMFFPVATIERAVHIEADDYDVDLQGINVANTNMKNFRNKPVFLNFWGTWCAPCRKEWPSIQRLYDRRKDQVDFVLIAMEDQEPAVRKFLQENNYTVPVYIAQSPISEKILPKAFPTTFLLDENGRILIKEDAATDWDSESIHQFIDNIVK